MAQAQFISDGQADFFQNVLSYAFLSECQRMEPESAQQRLDQENRPWGPEAAEAEYYSVWVELWTVVESNFEQLFSLFHSTFFKEIRSSFLFHHFPPTSFYSIIITLYWAIFGSDGMCDSCRSTRGKLGSSQLQDCVWTPFVNWLLLRVVHRFWYMTDLDCMSQVQQVCCCWCHFICEQHWCIQFKTLPCRLCPFLSVYCTVFCCVLLASSQISWNPRLLWRRRWRHPACQSCFRKLWTDMTGASVLPVGIPIVDLSERQLAAYLVWMGILFSEKVLR